ncbi:hypothetical protein J7E78_26865 [Paenibacillus polymyxa]|nr:hypothetical protein [Paenibacillus polymyxa]MBT2287147.1 hypothetical protein [Paenibacillus polymyxa]
MNEGKVIEHKGNESKGIKSKVRKTWDRMQEGLRNGIALKQASEDQNF